MESKEKETTVQTPPYLSFTTFIHALEVLSKHGLPGRIDASVLSKYSGGAQRQLLHALKFLNLIDTNSHPTHILKDFAGGDEEQRKKTIVQLFQIHFSEPLNILSNGTMQQIKDSFDYIKAEPSVKLRCVSFFLKGAKFAGFAISPHISGKIRTSTIRGGTSKRRKPESDEIKEQKITGKSFIKTNEEQIAIPIPIGPGKVWTISIDKSYSKVDVDIFIQVLGIILKEGAKN